MSILNEVCTMAQSLFVQVVLSEEKKNERRLSLRSVTLSKGTDESRYGPWVLSRMSTTIFMPTHRASQ